MAKMVLCFTKHCAMMANGQVDFGVELLASRYCCFTPGKRASGPHWVRGRVGSKAGLNDTEN
jgi:hypothetical protein